MNKEMKPIEECVVMAMDGSEKELFPFLPYILQDLWEIGADPEIIINLIKKHSSNFKDIKILDPGCGKGAVSVRVSKALGCKCHGIDAIPEFISFAKQKAKEYEVQNLCTFETGDIRKKIKELSGYDIVILGALGPVFGNYYETLMSLSNCIKKNGIIIIDDAYIEEDSNYEHPLIIKKNIMMEQIDKAGMKLVENDILDIQTIKTSNEHIFSYLEKRCNELIEKYPDKEKVFHNYIKMQEREIDVLENKVIATTMVIRRKE